MASTRIELDDELVAVLSRLNQPVPQAARELIVLELYRQAIISSGKAAQLLGMDRFDFIRRASRLGIPYFRMSAEEVAADADAIRNARR